MSNTGIERIPISILTGFLGSGKTTLLNRLLKSPEASESAVIINEFGEIGLDHLLIEKIDGETVLLESGCVCCTVRNDLVDTIARLLDRRRSGEVPPFRRIVLETTGLADPSPILHVLMTEPRIAGRLRADSVVCTVDAVNALATLASHHESERQAAMADCLVLTKTDLADSMQVQRVQEALRQLNAAAPMVFAASSDLDAAKLLHAGLHDPGTRQPLPNRWLGVEISDRKTGWHDARAYRSQGAVHGKGIQTSHVVLDTPLTWAQVSEWLRTLNERRGSQLLRVKGILNVQGQDGPVVVHGVQQLIHIPSVLPEWPSADRCSRIVFITDGLQTGVLKKDLDAILHPGVPVLPEERST